MVTENGQSEGNTSFLRAARNGQLDKVLEFLKSNIDINTSNANGLNALHLASKDGHVAIVEELLKRGAVVDAATKKGNTALHIASLAGQEEVVKILVQHGASVNVQSQNGFTPLYMAAQENHDNVVKFLLANGANQSLSTEDGFTPLAVAMQQGHDKVVAVLLENDTRGRIRLPALHIAAKKDDVKAAKLLLENDHNADVTSKSGFTPLHIASHYGNQQIANLLIQKGADVNYAAKHNITPLHVAAKWGKANMVALLLEHGATIDAKTRDGLTPLHCAARSGHEQVVDMLLERGAPISSKTKNGLAPLHMAAQGDHIDAARILLYHRAPVDEVTVDYLTALHVAAHCGHVRVAKLLLDRQADANARALNGFTPLHIACKKNRIKVVELLLKHGANIAATTESGLTPLHVASFMGCMNIAIYLLQHEANPNVPTVRGETPLHLAARANQTDIIRILLRNGAQVDVRAREEQTPLHIASRLGNVDIVMLLLQHGAKVDNATKDMYTALHIAAKEDQDEVAAILIDNGATLNAVTKKGFTPLHLAAKYGHLKVVKLLLQKESPVDAQGKNGVTPLHVALHYDNQDVALYLLDKGASPHTVAKNGHTPLHIAAKKNQMDIANTLLEYGANPDAESKAGFAPLHLSAQEGHADMSSLILEHKANVNHESKNGLTPIHLCAQEDSVAVTESLVKYGVNVNAATKSGYTPLHIAAHYGQINMVKFLLQQGAKIEAKTTLDYTPLHHAAQQGHANIVNVLLSHQADPNAVTTGGQTPLMIAQKLGYITVIDTLKAVTNSQGSQKWADEKYKVQAPELMHETFMSDSEEEGGEDAVLVDQTYRYLTADEMKSLGDDSLPIDVTRDERIDSNRIVTNIDNNSLPPQHFEDNISPEHVTQNYVECITKYPATDNIGTEKYPIQVGFLVSFLVDARGGAMRGCRHSGVRVIVPPRCAPSPTRITCRYVRPQRTPHPPPLMEGEALASRVLELGPTGVKFLGPVIIEVPHFAALRDKEREIVILRSDNGESWKEHSVDTTEDILHEVLKNNFEAEDLSELEDMSSGRITRIVTQDFPQYFAVVSRVRQEVHAIGPEGGMVSSTVVPQVQAVFPEGALTKKIKVGLQAQPIDPELSAKLLGHGVAVSPVVTVEPRRRKFHKAITLTMPAPKAHSQGMINQYSGSAPTLRLLCSITGGTTRAQWEDVTGSTPLTFVNDCVSFTTTVSARFWLMDCRNISDATKMATELYKEAIHVPFMAKFVVFAKRVDPLEARLRVFCMTDDKEDKTLEQQEQFTEVAKSRDVEVLEGKHHYIEFAGNLVPVTKSGEQLSFCFRAFKENRLPFSVRVKDQHAEAVSRCLFMKEPKVPKGEPPQQPICILNIVLPKDIVMDTVSLVDSDSYKKYSNISENYYSYRPDPRMADMSNLLGEDWIPLANQLGLTATEMNVIKSEYPDSTAKQAQSMLRMWLSQYSKKDQMNTLENALWRIGRGDIVSQCLKPDHGLEIIPRINKEISTAYRSKKDEYDRDNTETRAPTKANLEDQKEGKRSSIKDKYLAEEKEQVEEEEEEEEEEESFDKPVSERREKIQKRLSAERSIPASSQRREIVQEITTIKQQSLVEDKLAEVQQKVLEHEEKSKTVLSKTAAPKTDNKIIINSSSRELTPLDQRTISSEVTHKTIQDKEFVDDVTERLSKKDTITKLMSVDEGQKSPKLSKTPPPSPADFLLKEQMHASQGHNMSFNKDIIPHIAVTQGSDDEETEFLTLNEYATDVEDLEEDSVKVPRKEILKIKLNKGDYVTDQEDVEGSDENHELEFKADVDIDKHFQEIEVGEEVSEVYQEKGKKSLKKQQSMTTRSGSLTSKLTVEGNDTDEEEFDTDNEMQVKETPDSNVNIIAYNVATSMKEASFEADKKPSGLRVENQSGYLSAYSVSPNLSDFTDIEIIHSDAEEDEQVKKTNTKVKRKKRKSFHGRYNTDDEDVELSDDEIKTETKKPHRPKTVTKSKSVSLNYSSDNEDNYPVFPICKKVAEKNHILNVPEFNTNCPTDVEDFMSPTDEYVPFKSESLSDPEVEKKVNEATESQIVTSVKSVEKKLKTKSQGSVEDEDNDLDVIDLTDFKISNKSQRYAEREEYTSKSMHVSTDEEEFDEEVIIGSEVYQDLPLPNPTRNITIFSEKGTFSTVTILPLDKNETEPENTEFSAPETDEESVSEADEVADLKTPTNIPNMDWEVTTIQENSVDKTNFDILEIDENSPKIQRRRKPPKFKHLYEKQVNRQNRLRAEEQKKYEEKSDIEEVVILDDEEPDKPKESSKDKQNISFHEEDITSTDEESISPSNAKTTARNQKKRQANGAKIPLSPSQEVMYLKGGYFPEMQGTNWSTYFWLPNPVSANEKNSRETKLAQLDQTKIEQVEKDDLSSKHRSEHESYHSSFLSSPLSYFASEDKDTIIRNPFRNKNVQAMLDLNKCSSQEDEEEKVEFTVQKGFDEETSFVPVQKSEYLLTFNSSTEENSDNCKSTNPFHESYSPVPVDINDNNFVDLDTVSTNPFKTESIYKNPQDKLVSPKITIVSKRISFEDLTNDNKAVTSNLDIYPSSDAILEIPVKKKLKVPKKFLRNQDGNITDEQLQEVAREKILIDLDELIGKDNQSVNGSKESTESSKHEAEHHSPIPQSLQSETVFNETPEDLISFGEYEPNRATPDRIRKVSEEFPFDINFTETIKKLVAGVALKSPSLVKKVSRENLTLETATDDIRADANIFEKGEDNADEFLLPDITGKANENVTECVNEKTDLICLDPTSELAQKLEIPESVSESTDPESEPLSKLSADIIIVSPPEHYPDNQVTPQSDATVTTTIVTHDFISESNINLNDSQSESEEISTLDLIPRSNLLIEVPVKNKLRIPKRTPLRVEETPLGESIQINASHPQPETSTAVISTTNELQDTNYYKNSVKLNVESVVNEVALNNNCTSSLNLNPNTDMLIEVPVKRKLLRPKRYLNSVELFQEHEENPIQEEKLEETDALATNQALDNSFLENNKVSDDMQSINKTRDDIWWEGAFRDVKVAVKDGLNNKQKETSSEISNNVQTDDFISNYISASSIGHFFDFIQKNPTKISKANVQLLIKPNNRNFPIETRSVKEFFDEKAGLRIKNKKYLTLPYRYTQSEPMYKSEESSRQHRSLSVPHLSVSSDSDEDCNKEPTYTLPTLFKESNKGNIKLISVQHTKFPLQLRSDNESIVPNEESVIMNTNSSLPIKETKESCSTSGLPLHLVFHTPFENYPFPEAYCDWITQKSDILKGDKACHDLLTQDLTTETQQPQPKPRPSKLPENWPSSGSIEKEQTKPLSPVRDDLLDREDVPESYHDKRKFWENVSQDHTQKRFSYQEPTADKNLAKKRISVPDFSSMPIPKPRTVLQTSQSLIETETKQEDDEPLVAVVPKIAFKDTFQGKSEDDISQDRKLKAGKKKSSVENDYKGSGQLSEGPGYISDSEDVENNISDSEIEDRVPQIRDRMMSVFIPSASSACRAMRSASLPTEDLYEVSARTIKARKEYYEEQIRKEMIEEQLTSEIEEEPSPERKNLLSSTEEDRTEADARSIGDDVEEIKDDQVKSTVKVSFISKKETVKEKLQEQPSDVKLIESPESSSKVEEPVKTETIITSEIVKPDKKLTPSDVDSVTSITTDQKSPKHLDDQITPLSINYQINGKVNERIVESQLSFSSDRSGELIDEQNFKDDSHSTKPDSMEVLVDKSEIEDSEKLAELDQDIENRSEDSFDTEIRDSGATTLNYGEIKLTTSFESGCEIEKNVFTEQAREFTVHEVPRERIRYQEGESVIKEPSSIQQSHIAAKDKVQEKPEDDSKKISLDKGKKEIPDSTVKTTKDKEKTKDIKDKLEDSRKVVASVDEKQAAPKTSSKSENEESHTDIEKLIFDCLQQQKVDPEEAHKIANALVGEIEAEIQKQDTLEPSERAAHLEEHKYLPESLKHLAEIKGLDAREIELVESVLERRQRGPKFGRQDTQISSVEITDEDLKYSGEFDYPQMLQQQVDQLRKEQGHIQPGMFEETLNDAKIKSKSKTSEKTTEEKEWLRDNEVINETEKVSVTQSGSMKTTEAVSSEKLKKEDEKIFQIKDKQAEHKVSEESEIINTQAEVTIEDKLKISSDSTEIDISNLDQTKIETDHKSHIVGDELKIKDNDDTKEITQAKTHITDIDNVKIDQKIESATTQIKRDSIERIEQKQMENYNELNEQQEDIFKETVTKIEEKEDGTKVTIQKEIDTIQSTKQSTVTETHHSETISTSISQEPIESKDKSFSDASEKLEKQHKTIFEDKIEDFKVVSEVTSKPAVVLRKSKSDADTSSGSSVAKVDRKSGYDFEVNSSSGESHYHSFEMESSKSRPCSSDIEGFVAVSSSEYESALTSQVYSARSQVSSTDYQTPVSTLSSKESMKSLDSEGSENLASVEITEHSETLVPSTSDLEDIMDSTDQQLLTDESDQNLIYNSKYSDVQHLNEISDSEGISYKNESIEISDEECPEMKIGETHSKMKRSYEMTFQPEPKVLSQKSPSEHEEKFGTSLDDGSVFSMSMSSTSSMATQRTVIERIDSDKLEASAETSEHVSLEDVENVPVGSLDSMMSSTLTTDMSTSTSDANAGVFIESVTLTTSSVDVNGIQSVSTQVTSDEHVITDDITPLTTITEPKRKGHKRNESVLMGSKIIIPDQLEQDKKPKEAVKADTSSSLIDEFLIQERGISEEYRPFETSNKKIKPINKTEPVGKAVPDKSREPGTIDLNQFLDQERKLAESYSTFRVSRAKDQKVEAVATEKEITDKQKSTDVPIESSEVEHFLKKEKSHAEAYTSKIPTAVPKVQKIGPIAVQKDVKEQKEDEVLPEDLLKKEKSHSEAYVSKIPTAVTKPATTEMVKEPVKDITKSSPEVEKSHAISYTSKIPTLAAKIDKVTPILEKETTQQIKDVTVSSLELDDFLRNEKSHSEGYTPEIPTTTVKTEQMETTLDKKFVTKEAAAPISVAKEITMSTSTIDDFLMREKVHAEAYTSKVPTTAALSKEIEPTLEQKAATKDAEVEKLVDKQDLKDIPISSSELSEFLSKEKIHSETGVSQKPTTSAKAEILKPSSEKEIIEDTGLIEKQTIQDITMSSFDLDDFLKQEKAVAEGYVPKISTTIIKEEKTDLILEEETAAKQTVINKVTISSSEIDDFIKKEKSHTETTTTTTSKIPMFTQCKVEKVDSSLAKESAPIEVTTTEHEIETINAKELDKFLTSEKSHAEPYTSKIPKPLPRTSQTVPSDSKPTVDIKKEDDKYEDIKPDFDATSKFLDSEREFTEEYQSSATSKSKATMDDSKEISVEQQKEKKTEQKATDINIFLDKEREVCETYQYAEDKKPTTQQDTTKTDKMSSASISQFIEKEKEMQEGYQPIDEIKKDGTSKTAPMAQEIHKPMVINNDSYKQPEADVVFSKVPPCLSPAHKVNQICPILEDDISEKHEMENQETAKKKFEEKQKEIKEDYNLPDITVTQHMAPLADKNCRYPELELEDDEKETTIGTETPQTPASSSSKSSEETDQGREYVVIATVSTISEEPESEERSPDTKTEMQTVIESKTSVESKTIVESKTSESGEKETDSMGSSESFEMLDKPDIIDDFVVIEEVGKEADELDTEGKSVKITKVQRHKKKSSQEEEEEHYLAHSAPTPLTTTKISDVKYFPEDEFEESPPQVQGAKNGSYSTRDYIDRELEANRKWVEQQFQGDHASIMAAGYGYEMEFERGPLEDIKEEDITDFAASSYGSQKDSGGSLKESYSSTPEYDVLAGRKYFTRSSEHDDASMSSLQEFEKLEQAMSLEMRKLHQGSQDSSSNGSFKTRYIISKSGQGDDISINSLKEFEGLEKACIAAHKIEVKVKEEEALLAQIDEGQESIASESESCETVSGTEKKLVTDTDEEEDYEKRMFEIDEIIKQAQSNVERLIDLKDIEQTESLGRGDSVEEVSKVPDLDLDTPVVKSTIKVQWKENNDVMLNSTDSLETQLEQSAHHQSTDSLDQEPAATLKSSSSDSIETEAKKYSKDSLDIRGSDRTGMVSSDSLDTGAPMQGTDPNIMTSDSIDEDSSRFGIYDQSQSSTGRDLNSSTRDDLSHDRADALQVESGDNLDISSSTATHATYQYETDSVFSGSFTSGGSNTMVSSTNSIDQTKQGTSVDIEAAVRKVWFEETEGKYMEDTSKPYVTEIIEPCEDEYFTHTIHRTVELPPEVRKVTFTGADADLKMKQFIQDFEEGEECVETQEVDSDGNIHIRRVIKRRFVVKDDSGKLPPSEIEKYFKDLQPDKIKGVESDINAPSSSKVKVTRDEQEVSTSRSDVPSQSIKATRRRPLRYEISVEDQTEVDPREHDWRFNLPKHAEGEEGTSEVEECKPPPPDQE